MSTKPKIIIVLFLLAASLLFIWQLGKLKTMAPDSVQHNQQISEGEFQLPVWFIQKTSSLKGGTWQLVPIKHGYKINYLTLKDSSQNVIGEWMQEGTTYLALDETAKAITPDLLLPTSYAIPAKSSNQPLSSSLPGIIHLLPKIEDESLEIVGQTNLPDGTYISLIAIRGFEVENQNQIQYSAYFPNSPHWNHIAFSQVHQGTFSASFGLNHRDWLDRVNNSIEKPNKLLTTLPNIEIILTVNPKTHQMDPLFAQPESVFSKLGKDFELLQEGPCTRKEKNGLGFFTVQQFITTLPLKVHQSVFSIFD